MRYRVLWVKISQIYPLKDHVRFMRNCDIYSRCCFYSCSRHINLEVSKEMKVMTSYMKETTKHLFNSKINKHLLNNNTQLNINIIYTVPNEHDISHKIPSERSSNESLVELFCSYFGCFCIINMYIWIRKCLRLVKHEWMAWNT